MGNGERSGPTGFKFTRENLQSRIKKKDSVTNVENAVLDFGVVDLLCLLFVNQRVLVGLITKPNKLCARARSVDDMPFAPPVPRAVRNEYTRMGVVNAVKGHVRHYLMLTKRHGSRLRSFPRFFSNHGWRLPLARLFGGDTR
ncbi:hypothetical protein Tco_0007326 [Tanacetum coccineum]